MSTPPPDLRPNQVMERLAGLGRDQGRPTSDIDMQAMDLTLDASHMCEVVTAIAHAPIRDGLALDPDSVTVQSIRDDDEYTGLRVLVKEVALHGRRLPAGIKLDVSTGDPIWPRPQTVHLPGLLGGYVEVTGHPLPTATWRSGRSRS